MKDAGKFTNEPVPKDVKKIYREAKRRLENEKRAFNKDLNEIWNKKPTTLYAG